MFVNFNKRKLKKVGTGVLIVALTIGVAAGYQKMNSVRQHQSPSQPTLADTEVTNWGLSFQQDGQVPIGNASTEELGKYNGFYCGNTKKKIVFLTFDAGYENGYTPQILDVLKKEKIPAAFFVVGTYIKDNPNLIKRMVKEGHLVGNHTMSHPDMSAITSQEAFKKELSQVEVLYKETTGKQMKKFYRPPQGKFSFSNLELADQLGYTTAFWSLAYVDWYVDKQPSREEAMEKLMPRTHSGAVILLHTTSKTNAQILQELITNWKEEGYQFLPLEKLSSL